MKLLRTEVLFNRLPTGSKSPAWLQSALDDIHAAIDAVRWPRGSAAFTIRPVRMGNGVKPIKQGFQMLLRKRGWMPEHRISLGEGI